MTADQVADTDKPIRVQSQPRFMAQIDARPTKFYELMKTDPRFPRRFKIGKRWVFNVEDCNAYIRECAEGAGKAV